MEQTLKDELFGRSVITGADIAMCAEDGHDLPYEAGDRVGPKFDSVAAAIMHVWSLSSFQDEDCGDAQYGNGWHALFRDERAILHTDSVGFVSAWRVEDDRDLDEAWAEIERGAVYPDNDECPGHYDDDHTLTSGAGIGEPSCCDGSCR